MASNRRDSQTRAILAACREPVGSYDRLPSVLYVLYTSNIYEILLFNHQLVVMTCELIYVVQAAQR